MPREGYLELSDKNMRTETVVDFGVRRSSIGFAPSHLSHPNCGICVGEALALHKCELLRREAIPYKSFHTTKHMVLVEIPSKVRFLSPLSL